MTYLKQVLLDFLGSYEVQTGDGIGSVDWPWVMSAILLIVFIYCLIRWLGGMLRGK